MLSTIKQYCEKNWIHIILEGVDATGKTTLIDYLLSSFLTSDILCLRYKQPYTNIINDYFACTNKSNQKPEEITALFVADAIVLRQQMNITKQIFIGGGIILQDRHVCVSSKTYQSPHMKYEQRWSDILSSIEWQVCDLSLCFIATNEPFVQKEEMFEDSILQVAKAEYQYLLKNKHDIDYWLPIRGIDMTNTNAAIDIILSTITEKIQYV